MTSHHPTCLPLALAAQLHTQCCAVTGSCKEKTSPSPRQFHPEEWFNCLLQLKPLPGTSRKLQVLPSFLIHPTVVTKCQMPLSLSLEKSLIPECKQKGKSAQKFSSTFVTVLLGVLVEEIYRYPYFREKCQVIFFKLGLSCRARFPKVLQFSPRFTLSAVQAVQLSTI